MELMHVKLRNGEDLLGKVEKLNNGIRISAPISIEVDPQEGFFAKSWLMFSEDNHVMINRDDFYFCNVASQKAINYYEEFIYQIATPEDKQDDYVSDAEDMLLSIFESKHSTKH